MTYFYKINIGLDSPVIKSITRKNYEPEILENSNFVLLHIYKKKLPHPSWAELVAGFEFEIFLLL